MLTQIDQRHLIRKRPRHQRLDCLRHQHLATVRHPHQPGTPIQRRTEIVTVAELRLPRMQSHPHRQDLTQQNLRADRSRHRIRRRGEHRSDPIAGVLEEMPVVLVDQPTQDVVVLGQQRPHRLRIVLPPTRRTLNIRKQERHGPRRRLRHEPNVTTTWMLGAQANRPPYRTRTGADSGSPPLTSGPLCASHDPGYPTVPVRRNGGHIWVSGLR